MQHKFSLNYMPYIAGLLRSFNLTTVVLKAFFYHTKHNKLTGLYAT